LRAGCLSRRHTGRRAAALFSHRLRPYRPDLGAGNRRPGRAWALLDWRGRAGLDCAWQLRRNLSGCGQLSAATSRCATVRPFVRAGGSASALADDPRSKRPPRSPAASLASTGQARRSSPIRSASATPRSAGTCTDGAGLPPTSVTARATDAARAKRHQPSSDRRTPVAGRILPIRGLAYRGDVMVFR
jgi:hypothetical protein